MKRKTLLVAFLAACLTVFSGCSCEHVWIDADCANAKTCSECQETEGTALGHDWSASTCQNPKTCSRCGEVEGEALGHTAGEWVKTTDAVNCSVLAEQFCEVCNAFLASETTALDTLIQDDLFLFTPAQFMERLTLVAGQHEYTFQYDFIPTDVGLQVLLDSDGKQSLIQFFRSDATALVSGETDTAEIWCVSLTEVGESDGALRLYFLMTCDPTLDKDAAFSADMCLSTAVLNASTEAELFGYYTLNQLLYEGAYFDETLLGEGSSLNMTNVYASDFR